MIKQDSYTKANESGDEAQKETMRLIDVGLPQSKNKVNSTETQALSVGPCACHYSLFLCNFVTLFDFPQNTNND